MEAPTHLPNDRCTTTPTSLQSSTSARADVRLSIHNRTPAQHIGAADAAGEPLIALRGDPRFYIRFGFVPASELGVDAPDPA